MSRFIRFGNSIIAVDYIYNITLTSNRLECYLEIDGKREKLIEEHHSEKAAQKRFDELTGLLSETRLPTRPEVSI